MSEDGQGTGKIPLKKFLADFRSATTDQELRDKYELSARSFVSLIKALLAKEIISQADLTRRREMAVQRDLQKESHFLSGLYICPNCSHPHPAPFQACPACGFQVEGSGLITPSGDHFFLEPKESPEAEAGAQNGESPEAAEPPEPQEPAAASDKTSSFKSIKSLFSKLTKK